MTRVGDFDDSEKGVKSFDQREDSGNDDSMGQQFDDFNDDRDGYRPMHKRGRGIFR